MGEDLLSYEVLSICEDLISSSVMLEELGFLKYILKLKMSYATMTQNWKTVLAKSCFLKQ